MAIVSAPITQDAPVTEALLARIPLRRLFAVIFWCAGTLPTYAFIRTFQPDVLTAGCIAGILQAGLTIMESPLWQRYEWDDEGNRLTRMIHGATWLCLFFDVYVNFAGVATFVDQVHLTPSSRSIVHYLGSTMQPMSGWPAIVLCIVLGTLLAALPEYLWHED